MILRLLRDTVSDTGYGPHVILALDDIESYYTYVCHFYEDGDYATSRGCFISRGYGHIVLAGVDFSEHVVAHELAHAMLRDRALPLWLEEGLVQVLTDAVEETNSLALDHELVARHRAWWTPERVQAFRDGSEFGSPRGEAQELSYHLAHWLVWTMLHESRDSFLRLVKTATADDGGEAAMRATLGRGLNEQLERTGAVPAKRGQATTSPGFRLPWRPRRSSP